MTRFIDVPSLARLVNHTGERQFIQGMAAAIHEDFTRWQQFQKSARTANHCDVGVIELMPISDNRQYGFKYVNGHPSNTNQGLSTVMAFGALASLDTGYPLLLAELTLTTAFRTAATSVIAAKALCRSSAKSMAMIGCGAQAEFQILAFYYILGISDVNVYDIDPRAANKLQKNLAGKGIDIQIKASIEAAVDGVDIVTTATADKRWATILEMPMIAPGMHINAIGGDCPGKTELAKEILHKAKIFVEYEPQTRIEGEIQQLPDDAPVTPLWQVLTEKHVGRESSLDITLFDSVGFALEDFSALRYVYQLSKHTGIGKDIHLIPDLVNPKDLYHLIQTQPHTKLTREAS